MSEVWKVESKSGVNVRSGPSTSSAKVTALEYGTFVTATERGGIDNIWIHVEQGWICTKIAGKVVMSLCVNTNKRGYRSARAAATPMAVNTQTPAAPAAAAPAQEEESSGYIPQTWFYKFASTGYDQSEATTVRNLNAIFGVPYQFLPNADARLYDKNSKEVKAGASEDGAALGRVYASRIVSKLPLLLITPGKPAFMTRFGTKERKNMVSAMVDMVAGDASPSLEKLLGNKDGRYYTFEFDHVRYFNYVNPMCRIASQFLGVGDHIYDGIPLKNYNWGDGSITNPPSFLKSKLESFVNTGLPGCIGFYINSDTQISESFSNSTTESMLASKVNSVSDMGRELTFLLGYGSSALALDIDVFKDTDIKKNVENVDDFITGILGKNNFVQALAQNLTTVAKGGKLTFPEIWNDSSFTRSFDVNIKLTTPDSDPLSWYFNICVPLLHLIGLVAPQTINTNPNGYMSPFLIRGVYKGLFNIEMGIITSMNITKGQEGAWTKEGLPTVVDISFSIKDLYEAMSITDMQNSAKYDTMNNTALMDYIGNLCGINIFKPEIMRNLEMWFVQNVPNRAKDTIRNIFGGIEQATLNKIMELYERSRFL